MSMMVSFCAVFFPTRFLDEILNLIESVSEGFPSYSLIFDSDMSCRNQVLKLSLLCNVGTQPMSPKLCIHVGNRKIPFSPACELKLN